MNPTDFDSLLGRYSTDPYVEAVLTRYAVRNRPEVEIDDEDADGPVVETQSWVKNSRAGIEFGFQDEAAWIGLDETEFGKRPMLLTQIYLYGSHEGVLPYQESLPFDLQLTDDRQTVREKLARLEPTRHSHVRDTWDAPNFRITVSYAGIGIDFVLCMLREPPLPPLAYSLAPVPPLETLVQLLGHPLSDRLVQQTFSPFGVQDRIGEIKETGEVDFLNPHGFMLYFVPAPAGQGSPAADFTLSAVMFVQDRELDGRAWAGALPYGITFEDSPESVADKIGRPPNIQQDTDFSGNAVWLEPALSVQVFYNTMDNRVLRVSVAMPGFGES
jgi:hypothetical protein